VLRSSSATRPVLRIRPGIDISDPSSRTRSHSVFSGTRGIVRVSAGDQAQVSAFGNEPDLGTAFALATSVFGRNQVAVSGNFGYSPAAGMPAAGVSTRFSRGAPGGSGPEVKLTMRQLFMPMRAGAAIVTGQEEGVPALRTMSVGFVDRAVLTDDLRLEYGFSLDSVTFIDRLNYFSPFARLSYSQGTTGSFEFAYSSGTPSADMLYGGKERGGEFQRDLTGLALFPRVSLRDGRARVQRYNNFEFGYRREVGWRTYGLAVYRETVSNGALTMEAPAGALPETDMLPDLMSNSSVFNIGRYSSLGYMASASQALGDRFSVTAAYGSGGALTPERRILAANSAEDLRDIMRLSRRRWASAAFSGTLPGSGTQFVTSYRWTDGRSLTPHHYYLTQSLRPDVGWNLYLRQPIPAFPGLPGRLEATGDLRNLLAQGYLPLSSPQARRIYLIHTPRSVRGGLAFVF